MIAVGVGALVTVACSSGIDASDYQGRWRLLEMTCDGHQITFSSGYNVLLDLGATAGTNTITNGECTITAKDYPIVVNDDVAELRVKFAHGVDCAPAACVLNYTITVDGETRGAAAGCAPTNSPPMRVTADDNGDLQATYVDGDVTCISRYVRSR